MKLAPKILATLIIGVALGGFASRTSAADDTSKTAPQGVASDAAAAEAEHTAVAAAYDLRVADLDALIAQHQKMKKDSRARTYLYRHETAKSREADLAEMDKHCDAIIGDATRLRDELAEFAKWHRTQGANLQGK
jgi:hypothetical protein